MKINGIRFIHERDIPVEMIDATIRGIVEVMDVMGAMGNMPYRYDGHWQGGGHEQDGQLVPFRSVDWYIKSATEIRNGFPKVNAQSVLAYLRKRLEQAPESYMTVLLTKEPLGVTEQSINYVHALGQTGVGIVLSTHMLVYEHITVRAQLIKTIVMHELGHIFGLLTRAYDITDNNGVHCSNICIMRHAGTVVVWKSHTLDRLFLGSFCEECRRDLVANFKTLKP